MEQFDFEKIKRKPLWTNTKPNKKVLKDRFGFNIDEHPIIIFEYGNDIFYLKSQGVKYAEFNGMELYDNYCKDLFKNYNAVIVKKTNAVDPDNVSLFSKDSLIDTTQIFVMNKEDFLKCININEKSLAYTRSISKLKNLEVLQKVLKNISEDNFSLTRIKLENNKTTAKLLYCSKEILDKDYKQIIKTKINEGDLNQINEVYKFDYSKIKDDYQNNLYVVFKDEFEERKQDYVEFCNQHQPDKYYSLINRLDMLGINLHLSEKDIDKYIENDIDLSLETESFSDYEKDYYKQHPEEYKAKYKTYLETLKEAYFEYENKTKSKSSQNKMNKCKNLDDDFELER